MCPAPLMASLYERTSRFVSLEHMFVVAHSFLVLLSVHVTVSK